MALQLQERPGGVYDNEEDKLLHKPITPEDSDLEEIDELEKSFAADSATDEDLPDGHPDTLTSKVDAPKRLKERESETSEKSDNLYTDTGQKKKRARLSGVRRKGIIAGVIITIIVSITTFFLSLVSGPAQLLHLSQWMDRFHFSSNEEEGSSRLFKLTKYIKNRNKPQNNRLSVLGNKLANRWESKLIGSGVELKYNERTGIFEKFILDPEKLVKNPELEGLKNANQKEVQKYFKENFNVDLPIDVDGKLTINANDLSDVKIRKLNRVFFRNANYTKVGSALRARTIGTRQGLTWHPIKKLDRALYKTLDAKYEAWRKNKAQAQEQGAVDTAIDDPEKTRDTDSDGKPDAPSEEVSERQQAVRDVQEQIQTDVEAKGSNPEGGKFSGISNNLAVKSAGVASLAVGVVCLAQGLSGQIDQVQFKNSALPMMRAGMDFLSSGSQIMGSLATGQSVDLDQIGFLVRRLHDDTSGSWVNARSIQSERGEQLTGPDLPKEARIDSQSNPVTEFLNNIPGISTICGAANSAVGQAVSFGIDILAGGPFGAVFGQVTSRTVMPYVTDSFVSVVSGEALNVTGYTGAILGNIINYGIRLSANDAAIRSGARTLSTVEALQLQDRQLAFDKSDFATMSFKDRVFNLSDSRSLASKFIDNQSPEVMSNLASMSRSMVNVSNSFHSIASIFTNSKASAAQNYDYGFPKAGFSVSELNDPRYDDPFANATIVEGLLNDSTTRERAENCFGVSITPGGNGDASYTVVSEGPAPSYADLSKPENNCADTSENWTRIRMFILDSATLEAYSCYEAVDDTACSNTGMGSTASSSAPVTASNATPSAGLKLPSGSAAQLAQQLLASPNVKSSNPSQLQNIANGSGPCPSVNNGKYQVDSKLLAVLVALSQNNTFTISSLHRGCTGSTVGAGTASRHWQGRAVDISGASGINGVVMNGFGSYDPKIQDFINQAKNLLPNDCELGVANNQYKNGAMSITSPCSNVFLDTPGTTGATGPHVHLGV